MAFNLAGAAAGVEIASGIKGLVGGSGSSPIKQMKTQLSYDRQKYLAMSEGARNAGFNPLTVLQAGGANTGFTASAGGAPPLASAEILAGGLRDLNDELSGENDRRRAANQLEQDLAQVKLDTMRAALAGPSAADAVGLGPSTFGRRAVATSSVKTSRPAMASADLAAPVSLAPGRKVDVQDVPSTPGIMAINNAGTRGQNYYIPGFDGEPMGLDEFIVAAPWLGVQDALHSVADLPAQARRTARAIKKEWVDPFLGNLNIPSPKITPFAEFEATAARNKYWQKKGTR